MHPDDPLVSRYSTKEPKELIERLREASDKIDILKLLRYHDGSHLHPEPIP